MFSLHANANPAFDERFRDGLVWTVGLTVEIKPRFRIFPV